MNEKDFNNNLKFENGEVIPDLSKYFYFSTPPLLGESFEIGNGILGTKRDVFLSILPYIYYDDRKTRNVWFLLRF
jgi:hypothetical protein